MQDDRDPIGELIEQRESFGDRPIDLLAIIAIAEVDYQRQPELAGDSDLRLEGVPLLVTWGAIAVVVEPGLADRPYPWMGGEGLEVGRGGGVEAGGGVRVASDAREHFLVCLGGLHSLPVGGLVEAHGEDSAHARIARRSHQLVVGRLANRQVRVRIYHGRSLGLRPGPPG